VNIAKLLQDVQPYIQKEYLQAAFPEPLPKIEFNANEIIR
jgi:hypothetical protein